MRRSINYLFLIVIIHLNCHLILQVKSTSVFLEHNGYSNVVIAISSDVSESIAGDILPKLQHMIREASSVLYRATRNRAYFKDVRILVPETWKNIPANASTWETYSTADVRVAPAQLSYGDVPYTLQSGGCGKPGEYIHLTPDYIRNSTETSNSKSAIFRPPGKMFVHEWAHLRYGVFNDYESFTGPLVKQKNPYLIENKATCFCNKEGHFHDVSDKQNAMCGSLSVWEVISSHQDFARDRNPARNIIDLEPKFQIVRSSGAQFALVLDLQQPKTNHQDERNERVYDAVRRWIKYDITEGNKLAVVRSNEISQLTTIKGANIRDAFISGLNFSASAEETYCHMGCLVQKALTVLQSGGTIILLSDRLLSPSGLSEIDHHVVKAGTRVVSIAIGQRVNDHLEMLVDKTNGKSYFITENNYNQELSDALIGSQTFASDLPTNQISVVLFKRQFQNVAGIGKITEHFLVDDSVGRNLKLRIDYTQRNYLRYFSLTSPSGVVYRELVFDETTKVATFKLPRAEVGKWRFSLLVNHGPLTDALMVRVTSQANSETTAPITAECYIPDGRTNFDANEKPVRILAKVMSATNPVIGAKVRAFVRVPSGKIDVIDLYDNGTLADTFADDGVYSRYFVNALSLGRYAVSCVAWDDNNSAYVKHSPVAAVKTKTAGNLKTTKPEPTGEFTRTENGGSFMINKPTFKVSYDYKPSRIADLTAIDANMDDGRGITVEFTASGEDLDWGTALRYEIRYSTVCRDVEGANFTTGNSKLVQQNRVFVGSLQPLESGSKQKITFSLSNDDRAKTYFVALRSVDHADRASQTSNIATVTFHNCPVKCLSQYPGYCWRNVKCGTTARMSCPSNFEGTASWTCGADGKWTTPFPDLSNCVNPIVEKAVNKINQEISEDPSAALAHLVSAIDKEELASGNIIQMDRKIKLALRKLDEILEEWDNWKNTITAFMDLNDKLLGSQKAFSGLPRKERNEAIDSIQKNVDETVRLLADDFAENEKYQRKVVARDNLVVQVESSPKAGYGFEMEEFDVNNDKIALSPGLVNAGNEMENRLAFTSYSSMQDLLYSDKLSQWEEEWLIDETATKLLEQVVVTNVLGASLCQQRETMKLIDDKIEFILSTKNGRYDADESSATCVYWDTKTHDWSSEGCEMIQDDDVSTTKCQCDRRDVCNGQGKLWRLINFAVLMNIKGLTRNEIFNWQNFSNVSALDIAIGIATCLLLVVVCYRMRKLRSSLCRIAEVKEDLVPIVTVCPEEDKQKQLKQNISSCTLSICNKTDEKMNSNKISAVPSRESEPWKLRLMRTIAVRKLKNCIPYYYH